ncbi:hypothetical protein H7J89_08240 [Mycobacterium paraffinicum]|nr:hypothetical protein [Mycobacterium paraffinicum]
MSVAQAEEAAVLAEARAHQARARARRLSEKAGVLTGNEEVVHVADGGDIEDAAVDESLSEERSAAAGLYRSRLLGRRWLRRPGRMTLALSAAVILICTALGASGYVVQYHRTTAAQRQRAAEFAAAARQDVVFLMSIDAGKARDDVQRIIDDSTGPLKTGLLLEADELVKAVEQSKVSTKVDVKAVAVESMTDDSATVLVAAKAEVVNPDKSKPSPRSWRVIATIQRDGDRFKLSRADLLP